MLGALESFPAHDEVGVGKQEPHRLVGLVGAQQSAGMVEVQMRQDDAVDVDVGEPCLLQIVEQDMSLLLDAEAVAKLRGEESSDTGFKQDLAVAVFDQQRPARERDSIELVGLDPLAPERARRVAKHRAAVQTLRIAQNRPCSPVPHRCSLSG